MIVYQVANKFRAFKDEADTERKLLGLPPKALSKIRIDDRYQLADFLSGLFEAAATHDMAPEIATAVEAVAPSVPNRELAADYVPQFVLNDWAKRSSYKEPK